LRGRNLELEVHNENQFLDRPMLFDTTLRKDLSRTFGGALVVILTIVLTMMLIRTLGQAAGGAIAPQDVVLLLGYTALGHLPTMLTLSLFIAVVVCLGRMYRDSEMAIWFASGVGWAGSCGRCCAPAWPVLLVVIAAAAVRLALGQPRAPTCATATSSAPTCRAWHPGVFQTSRDGSRVFFVERARPRGDQRAQRVHPVTPRHAARASRRPAAGTAGHRPAATAAGARFAASATRSTPASGERTAVELRYLPRAGRRARAARATSRPPKAMRTVDLLRDPRRAPGRDSLALGMLFGAANLVLLGVGLAATNPRRASNWNLLLALLAFVVYFNLINLSQAWVASGKLGLGPMLVAARGALVAGLGADLVA
jgi:lipopolysaccharide export system permease protein